MITDRLMVKKIVNNNIVIAENYMGQEVIAIGKGLGFRKEIHDMILPHEASKTYMLLNNVNYISRTLEQIPYEVVELTEKIIDIAQKDLKNKFNVNLVVALADHINFSVNQYRAGFDMPVLVNEEVKRFYKEEYAVGKKAIEMINKTMNVDLSKEEAASIAFHLIAATENRKNHDSLKIMKGVGKIIHIVENDLNLILDEESIEYSRFVIHLKFFMRSILFERVKQVTNDAKSSILLMLEKENDEAKSCINKISEYVLENYDYSISEEDRLYLLIHVIRVLEKHRKKS